MPFSSLLEPIIIVFIGVSSWRHGDCHVPAHLPDGCGNVKKTTGSGFGIQGSDKSKPWVGVTSPTAHGESIASQRVFGASVKIKGFRVLTYFEYLSALHPAVSWSRRFCFWAADWLISQCRHPAPAGAVDAMTGAASAGNCWKSRAIRPKGSRRGWSPVARFAPKCKNQIAWYDNIPVVSWLVLRARCRHCDQKISFRYPLVELVTAVASVLVVHSFGPSPEALGALALTWALIAATGIDFDHQLLPDQITLPLLWLGLFLNLWLELFVPLEDAVIWRDSWLRDSVGRVSAVQAADRQGRHGGTVISSCLPRWAPGWAGGCCRLLFCLPRSSVRWLG